MVVRTSRATCEFRALLEVFSAMSLFRRAGVQDRRGAPPVCVYSLVPGGEFGENRSNRMMCLRRLFQAVAIIIVTFLVSSNNGG